ncbi:hypothetical protein SCB49_04160 [unidentified eubacterium SCB49]|nr:hypothetical protein SCB49_04160 [unidentified eubacterium SCB49]
MTTVEKRQKIKDALETFNDAQIEETLQYISKVKSRDEKRQQYVEALLTSEKNLFDRLAQ